MVNRAIHGEQDQKIREKMEKIKTRWSSYPQIVKKFEGENK